MNIKVGDKVILKDYCNEVGVVIRIESHPAVWGSMLYEIKGLEHWLHEYEIEEIPNSIDFIKGD